MNATEVVISIEDRQITGKDFVCTEMNVSTRIDELTEITLTLIGDSKNLWSEFVGDYSPKIRDKKVEECSIQELLFAVREKIKSKK